MTSVTIRTGANRPVKCSKPKASDGAGVEASTCPPQTNGKHAESRNSPELEPESRPETESSHETFQAISPDNRREEAPPPTVDRRSRDRCHGNTEEEEEGEDGADVLARFVPKGDDDPAPRPAPKDPPPGRDLRDSEDPPGDLAKQPISTTALSPPEAGRATDRDELPEADRRTDRDGDHSRPTADESGGSPSIPREDRGVSIVLGSGHSPEDDPDHSMLKFAVFEVQDLTEELKKLRDLLDTFSENGDLDPHGEGLHPDDDPRPSDPPGESETGSRTRSPLAAEDRLGVEAAVRSLSAVRITATSTVTSSSVKKGSLKSVTVDCKTQSEITYRGSSVSSSFAVCDLEGHSTVERRSFQGFGKEVAAAVK